MSTVRTLCLVLPTCIALFSPKAPAQNQEWIYKKGQTKIMCLGNSITQWPGWRLYLQDSLRVNGYTYRYVGGNSIFLGGDGYSSVNSGFWGARITDLPNGGNFIRGNADWKGLQPDLILMEIGTNDIQNGSSTAPQDLGTLIDRIYADVPNAVMLISNITPFRQDITVNNQRAITYNAQVPGIITQKANAGRKVKFVDIYSSISTDPSFFHDNVHPNDRAHRLMAARWFEAVKSITATSSEHPPSASLPPVVRAMVAPTFTPLSFGFRQRITVNPSFMKTVNFGETVRLLGSLIDGGAPSATGITYTWSQVWGPGIASFVSPNALNTDVTFSGAGQYGLCLTATRNGLTGKGYCRVTVKKSGGDDFAPGTYGKAISVNLTASTTLASTDQAGVVPRTNWNNAGCFSPLQNMTLTMSDGTKPAGLSYDNIINSCVSYQQPNGGTSADAKMMGTGVFYRDGHRHRIWGIPFARYDLYLYFTYSANGVNEEFNHSFIIRNMFDDQWLAGPFFARNVPNFDGTFTRLPTNSTSDTSNAPAANYLVIPNLTVKDIYLYLEIGPGRWPFTDGRNDLSPLNGIQVVERTDGTNSRISSDNRGETGAFTLGSTGIRANVSGKMVVSTLKGQTIFVGNVAAHTRVPLLSHKGTIYVVKFTTAQGTSVAKISVPH